MLLSNVFSNMFDDRMFGFFPMMDDHFTHEAPQMRSDIREYDDHYNLSMELAGFGKNDVKVDLDNGYLTVHAERNNTNDEKDDNGRIIRSERFSGSCQRSFYVGDKVKKEDIAAQFEDGILHLNIQKPALTAPADTTKYIEIQ
ncbi:MAG: Hsp20/alpha crystallin family protein [Clostridia bacterium]|nr:Hsp20/alpha crystallin family protein [Clostridia bacterium]